MKKLVFLFSALLLLASCSKSFKVNVEIEKWNEQLKGKQAYLIDYDSGDTVAIATIAEKHFTIEGELEKPFVGILLWDPLLYPMLKFVVDEGETNVVIGDNLKASGQLNEKMSDCESQRVLKYSNGDKDYDDVYLKCYQENKENILGQWAFCEYVDSKGLNDAEINKLLKDAPAGYAQLKLLEKLKYIAHQAELTSEDKDYIDFEVTHPGVRTQRLSDYVGTDHFTIVWFFWPAMVSKDSKELMILNAMHEKSNGDFVVVGVPVFSNEELTKTVMTKLGIKFPVFISDDSQTEVLELYGLHNVSSYFVTVGGNGKILWRDYNLDEIIQGALTKNN